MFSKWGRFRFILNIVRFKPRKARKYTNSCQFWNFSAKICLICVYLHAIGVLNLLISVF